MTGDYINHISAIVNFAMFLSNARFRMLDIRIPNNNVNYVEFEIKCKLMFFIFYYPLEITIIVIKTVCFRSTRFKSALSTD